MFMNIFGSAVILYNYYRWIFENFVLMLCCKAEKYSENMVSTDFKWVGMKLKLSKNA